MERFVVRKDNTPCVHQWVIIDTNTANKLGVYKTKQLADQACSGFGQHGLPKGANGTPPCFENAWGTESGRMERSSGDLIHRSKRKTKHSNKRIVELY